MDEEQFVGEFFNTMYSKISIRTVFLEIGRSCKDINLHGISSYRLIESLSVRDPILSSSIGKRLHH